ncbi:MAG TPA: hypothetical protein VM537_14700 [Anaerolineae bacterium]|nr:hypothetical protein [Anaerolineae bacterium]
MRAVIAVPFYDTLENGRSMATKETLNSLRGLDCRHAIVPVDNGSTYIAAFELARDIYPAAMRLSEPRSVAHAVNAAWAPFHDELVRGDMIAVKLDSDVEVLGAGWLEQIIDGILTTPNIGLLGVRHPEDVPLPETMYHGVLVGDFVRGSCVARSPECFRAIGYCRHPGDTRWGWQDHWDCFRAKTAGFRVGRIPSLSLRSRCEQDALPEAIKTVERAKGREALVQWMSEVRNGKRPLFEEAT